MTSCIVRAMPEAAYHRGPELSSTGVKALLDCPARYWQQATGGHADKRAYDEGHLVHELVLGVGQGLHVVDADSWRTKAAQDASKAARRDGKVPVLRHQLLNACRIRRAIRREPLAGRLLFGAGESEVSLFWTDAESGVDCRARVDRVTTWLDGRDALIDLKTIGEEGAAAPDRLPRRTLNHGQHIQAAMYLDGAVACGLVAPDAVFLHVHVELDPPHVVTVSQLTEDALVKGRSEYRRGIDTFRECTVTGRWPAYSDDVVSVDLPAFAYREDTP